MAVLIPAVIPASPSAVTPPPSPSSDPSSLYDVSVGGIEFVFSNTPTDPMIRETVPLEKERIDQAPDPGQNTLTGWWIGAQEGFQGGAGQLQLEPAFPTPYDQVRYDGSKNVDISVPGRVTRLPDTSVLTTDSVSEVLGVVVAGADAVAYLTGTTVKVITALTTTPVITTMTGITGGGTLNIATDGQSVFAATATDVWLVNPATAGATKIATYPATATSGPVLGWVKARLMLGVNGAVYELDITQSGVTLGATQLRYQHPTAGFVWRCFGVSPTAIVAAGDALGQSTLTQFNINLVSGAPVLQVQGDIAPLPVGERVLAVANSQGSFLVLGTTKGIRVGTFDTYTGALTYGPLELQATDPVIPAVSLAQRDRFVFAAGLDYDEGGLIRVDLGSKVDQAGRFAWSPDLVAPVTTATAATSVTTLPVSGLLVFSIPGTGVLLEGSTPGTVREAWLRTSRIRFDTTEPKLFKLGRVRGDLISGEIKVTGITPVDSFPLATVGFTETDPGEFRLPVGLNEWLQLKLELIGSTTQLTSYQVKALPGSRRQRHYQFVLSIADSETTKTGQRTRDALSSRDRLAALEEMNAGGDEVILQEFTPNGVISTRVVVELVSFKQVGRPTRRSDIGGDVTVLLRTVES